MVYTLGESLLDIIAESPFKMVPKPGGGMLNTAVSLGRSGVDVSLISELGDDGTSTTILDFLKANEVYTKFIKKYYRQNTSIAVAYLDENKKPTFSIYKSYPEKRRLIGPGDFKKEDILIFGSLYSLDPLIREELKPILIQAKQAGAFLVYDPNIRRHKLDEPEIKQALNENLSFAHIIKASDEDLINIFGEDTDDAYWQQIKQINPNAIFVLTKGEKGVVGFLGENIFEFEANKVELVSTIGAGDAFNAGMVYELVKSGMNSKPSFELTEDDFVKMLAMGQKFAAAVCGTLENYVGRNEFRG